MEDRIPLYQLCITKAESKNPCYFEVIHKLTSKQNHPGLHPCVTLFRMLVKWSYKTIRHCLFAVFTVYQLIPKATFFSRNLPFLEFSTAFLTFTHCFHAEYASASFCESVDRGGAIGSGPLFWETMLISPLVHRHWGEKTVERTSCGVCGGSGDPVDLHHAFKVFLYTPHQIPTTVKYRLSTFYCCLTCCLG